MTNTNSLSVVAVALIAGAVAITGIVFGGKEVINNTIDTSTVETVSTPVADSKLGGLVEVFQKMFTEGLIIGRKEVGQTGVQQFIVDSSNNLYIGSSTDATFKIGTDGRITMRNVNFTTSSLNWGGDLAADGDSGPAYVFYSDQSTSRFGVGTSTPSYQLEVVNAADVVLALTATSTNDAIIRFNGAYQAAEWLIYMDNSDGDKFKIGTSTDHDLLTIDEWGNVTILRGLGVATTTISGTLTVSGASTFVTTTAENLVQGGLVCSITSASSSISKAQFCNCTLFQYSILAGGSSATGDTLQLPAASTLVTSDSCIGSTGQSRKVSIQNYSTSTSALRIVKNSSFASSTVYFNTSTDAVVYPYINAGQMGFIDIMNINDTSTTDTITIFSPSP